MRDYESLISLIKDMDSVLVAYSGGVDSTLIAKAATEALEGKAVCAFVDSELMARRETSEAVGLARDLGLQLTTVSLDPLSIEDINRNTPERCYHCKKAIFRRLREIADERGLKWVIDGSNADDGRSGRPGLKALAELGVRSPLRELRMSKSVVRAMSRQVGLPNWNKPARPCLATRVPYGTPLDAAMLERIEAAEEVLHDLGFEDCRVRDHGSVARIEVPPNTIKALLVNQARNRIIEALTNLGYAYITVDLRGYVSGSMDRAVAVKPSED